MSVKDAQKAAEVAKQTGHGVAHKSPHPAEAKKDTAQASQHNRDMERIEQMHQRGFKK